MSDVIPEGTTTSKELFFVRESSCGEIESDPDYKRFSDNWVSSDTTISANKEKQRGASGPDAVEIRSGSENSTFTVSYHLQRWLSDSTADPLNDAFTRTNDDSNKLPNSHGLYEITKRANGGAGGSGIYTYTIGKGAKASTATITLDSSTGIPVVAEIEYQVQKLRSYQIDQPESDGTLDITSTSDDDTMDIDLEDDASGSTQETVTLTGTTTATTTSSFSNLRGALLASAPKGDVTVSDSDGNTLLTIRGSNSYPPGYTGDRGVPTVGNGSFESALGNSYYIYRGDAIDRPSGTALDDNIIDASWEVDNNIETDTHGSDQKLTIHEGNRDLTFSATIHGTTASHDKIDDLLIGQENAIRWVADSANSQNLQLEEAERMNDATRARNESDAKMTLDVEYSGTGLTVDAS
jgi:hypothetical protein